MPHDLALKAMNATHRLLLTASGGKLGWSFMGMPVIELTTTGRKSGQPRKTMLTSPLQEGSTIVIVASRGGDDRNPAWYLNVKQNPIVEVKMGAGPARRMRADLATPEERARMWPELTKAHSNYAGYQRRTTREIPLVLLRPIND